MLPGEPRRRPKGTPLEWTVPPGRVLLGPEPAVRRPRSLNGRHVMRRKLSTFAVTVSLLVCAAVVGLWVRSYWRRDGYTSFNPPLYRSVWSNRGVLIIYGRRTRMGPVPEADALYSQFPIRSFVTYDPWPTETFFGPHRSVWNRVGFGLWNEPTYTGVMFPHWSLAVPLLVPAAIWYARRRRYPVGCCPRCGYDLRASPDRCPECGEVSPIAPQPSA